MALRKRARSSTVWRGIRARLPIWAGGLFTYFFVFLPLRASDVPATVSWLIGALLVSTFAIPFVILSTARDTPDYEAARAVRPWFLANFSTLTVVVTQVLVNREGYEPLLVPPLVWGLICAFITWTGVFQLATERRAEMLDRVLTVEKPELAMELAELCWETLADETISDERRTTVEVTLAGVLISLSGRSDQEDLLPEAFEILDGAVETGPPVLVYSATAQLVEAMRVKALRTSDEVGWDEALAALGEAAERVKDELPDALAAVQAAQATRFEYQAANTRDPADARQLHEAALTVLGDAVASTQRGTDEHALRRTQLARLSVDPVHPLHMDLDDAIRTCRRAVRRLRWVDSEGRTDARLALVDLRVLRARLAPEGPMGRLLNRFWPNHPTDGVIGAIWASRATDDLIRANALCMQVAIGGDTSGEASRRLPMLRRLLVDRLLLPLPDVLIGHTDGMYSRVVTAQMKLSHTGAAKVAAEWAGFAVARGDAVAAAEAWWCWVTAVAADLRRRVLHDKEHRVSEFQGLFIEAAERLVAAGRLRDAAVTLDLGRAMLLTERMHRDRDDLEARLIAAGEHELAEDWRIAGELIELTDRATFGGADGLPAVVPSHVSGAGLASTEYLALTEHEGLLQAISRLDDFEDVDAAPDYDVLRDAASEGPIVYLVAGTNGGFALVVGEGPEPVRVALPELSTASVTARVTAVRSAERADDERETGGAEAMNDLLAVLVPDLWTEIVEPLVAHLPSHSLVTLIPNGVLGELPLHMAGVGPGDDGIWRDRTAGMVFRYAPNARVLLRARHTAQRLAGERLRVLTVSVPDAPGFPPLDNAPAESRGVAALFADHADRPEPADVSSVRRHLDDCAVWHFACHGEHRPLAPLDSTLVLADGPLTARELFARLSSPRRLAVLSACQTTKVASDLPDEAVGFPSAMLQAGVAGVVSCQAKVDDDAATLLVLAFVARFDSARPPARALAEAQAWLLGATNADIHQAFPDFHREPYQELEEDLRRWREDRPFSEPGTWMLFNYTGA
jgi:hypothetical protein